jgi:hypothetical protein
MSDIDTSVKLQFLPIGHRPRPATPHKASRDREADPRVKRDRALGDYGWKLLEAIDKDYQKQITVWKDAFADVVAAYATAVDMRNKTFEEAKEERERDAARAAFVFSLVTGGAMVFLGAWVQYAVIPKFTVSKYNLKFSDWENFGTKVTTARFSNMQASMFGGITKEVGGKLIPLAFPKPKAIPYPMDLPSVGFNLTADFGKLVDESSAVVRDQLSEAQTWMNESTEFGEAWAAYTGGNAERARTQIRLHFDKLRQEWANNWEFFGKTPKQSVRKLVADQYERGLWAAYIINLFDQAVEALRNDPRFKAMVERLKGRELELLEALEDDPGLPQGLGDMHVAEKYYHKKWVEAAIVNRLKELNVVVAETDRGKLDQTTRVHEGSPTPEAHIKGAVNRGHDIEEIYGWADFFLMGAADESAYKFFPPAKPRTLAPLPSYQ